MPETSGARAGHPQVHPAPPGVLIRSKVWRLLNRPGISELSVTSQMVIILGFAGQMVPVTPSHLGPCSMKALIYVRTWKFIQNFLPT